MSVLYIDKHYTITAFSAPKTVYFSKVLRFSEFEREILFPNFDEDRLLILEAFLETLLVNLYQAISRLDLVNYFGIKEKYKGPKSFFPREEK